MFKGPLIVDMDYYPERRKKLIIGLVAAGISFAPLSWTFTENKNWIIFFILFYVIAIFAAIQVYKKIEHSKNGTIEIDENQISITTNSGQKVEDIALDQVDQIVVKNNYHIPEESIRDMAEEINGNHTKNYIELVKNNQTKRYHFEITTYYMLTQLNKITNHWRNSGYDLQYID